MRIKEQSGLTCPDSPYFLIEQQMFFLSSSCIGPSLSCYRFIQLLDQVICWLWSILWLPFSAPAHTTPSLRPKFTCCHFLCPCAPRFLHNVVHPKIYKIIHEIKENVSYTWRNERIFSGCCCFLMICRGLERGSSTVKGAGSHLGNLYSSCSFPLNFNHSITLGKEKKW